MSKPRQTLLPVTLVRNRGLFSNHWFENRLGLEPEWKELRDDARRALDRLAKLWETQRDRVERYRTEAPLEQAFIQPVFEALGWKLIYQTHLQGRKPDYALFVDDDRLDTALGVDRNSADFWKYPTVVADAKAWHVPLNRPSVVNNQREYPPQQIEWYLDRSRLDFGVLANGGLWRLVPREYGPQQRRFQTYLECDLGTLLEDWRNATTITARDSLTDEFLEFYLFFGPVGYRTTEQLKPLVDRAIEGSSEYRVGVGEGLKERAFEALRLCIEGFLTYAPNDLLPAVDLERCRNESFILLYRLLFIMYAEDRRLLPYRINQTYTANRSLGRHRDEIAGRLDRAKEGEDEDFSHQSTSIWDDLSALFDLVDSGHKRYGVPEYNGGLFQADAHPFFLDMRMSDYYLARVIDQLSRAPDPLHPRAGLFRVDYRDLAIQHLGGIYEGLLELQPTSAQENMVVISRRVQGRLVEEYWPASKAVPRNYQLTDRTYRKGSIYLKTEKGERRASGSYYTPDHIVDYIVENTLGPLCKAVSDQLNDEITREEALLEKADGEARPQHAARLEQLRSEFDDRILQLKILDPAMGSGHFLIRACHRLAEEIATNEHTGNETASAMLEAESAVSYWKRRIVENCLYGVDINSLAVELAKLALWLETVAGDEPLSFLDHHLHHGNSLVGGTIANMGMLPDELEIHSNRFGRQVEEKLPLLLEPLDSIRQMPSDTAEHVKEKDALYRRYERAREPFCLAGDLWVSAFCAESELTPERYQMAVDELGKPRRFASLAKQKWFRNQIAHVNAEFVRPFHWEIEFPEVFFDGTHRRDSAGFDAVIGNPPYDVLSEQELGRDLAAFKAFIEHQSVYDPSREGKNNLYKLFICRALELLKEGGYFGFITPMAVLGDKIAVEIRRKIVQLGHFTSIEAFPQKDNPEKRVFPEAKLSTTVFTIVRRTPTRSNSQAFRSRVHPAQWIESESPSLNLTADQIPLYDPANFTIVSCSQDDWDLATKIMRSGRMTRLREFAEFFQGEVNETNERKRGVFVDDPREGKLVTRGASICLYVTRPASQGTDLYLNVSAFLDGKGENTKAYHHFHPRIGLQESSPQNNFRRIIAGFVPAGEFCNHTVNYCPATHCDVELEMLLALLNSKLADWYFRLGSTNAHVSHYQVYNLPCPVFAATEDATDKQLSDNLRPPLQKGHVDEVFTALSPHLDTAPFRLAIRNVVVAAVKRIIAIERQRGEISRVVRSSLNPAAQPYQDLIDRLLFAMAGLTAEESAGVEERLRQML